MTYYIALAVTYFSILSGLSGLIGGILLILAGEWSLLFYLIIASVFSPFVMAFVMLPSFLIAMPAIFLKSREFKMLSGFFAWIAALYLGLVFAGWSAYVFVYVMNITETFWGGIFASFGTAISPIIFMASKQPVQDAYDATNQVVTNFVVQFSTLIMVIMGVFYGGTLYEIGSYYIVTFAALSLIQVALLWPYSNSDYQT